jgi:hypothetical protein
MDDWMGWATLGAAVAGWICAASARSRVEELKDQMAENFGKMTRVMAILANKDPRELLNAADGEEDDDDADEDEPTIPCERPPGNVEI